MPRRRIRETSGVSNNESHRMLDIKIMLFLMKYVCALCLCRSQRNILRSAYCITDVNLNFG